MYVHNFPQFCGLHIIIPVVSRKLIKYLQCEEKQQGYSRVPAEVKRRLQCLVLHAVPERLPWRSYLVMPRNADCVLFRILSYPSTPPSCRVILLTFCMVQKFRRWLCTCASNVYKALSSCPSLTIKESLVSRLKVYMYIHVPHINQHRNSNDTKLPGPASWTLLPVMSSWFWLVYFSLQESSRPSEGSL